MIVNTLILKVNSYSNHPPFRRYLLNVSQIAWIRELDKDDRCRDLNGLYKENGTLICMSDGTKIVVDDDIDNIIRCMAVLERMDNEPIEFIRDEQDKNADSKI